MGRIIRLITGVVLLPLRLLAGLAVGLWGACYALWIIGAATWREWRNPSDPEDPGADGPQLPDVLSLEDWEDPEPETTEPLSRSLDMLGESMDEIRIVPKTPFVPWWKRPGAKPR